MVKLLNVFRLSESNQRSYYNLPNSAFWGWLSMESQPQNPEFRINPENFNTCIIYKVDVLKFRTFFYFCI